MYSFLDKNGPSHRSAEGTYGRGVALASEGHQSLKSTRVIPWQIAKSAWH